MRVSQVILSAERSQREILEALANRLTFSDNFQAKQLTILDSGPANTDLVIIHGLGKKPTGYIANIDQAGIVYDSNRSTWDEGTMTIRCSVSNASVVLVIF